MKAMHPFLSNISELDAIVEDEEETKDEDYSKEKEENQVMEMVMSDLDTMMEEEERPSSPVVGVAYKNKERMDHKKSEENDLDKEGTNDPKFKPAPSKVDTLPQNVFNFQFISSHF